MLAPHIKKSLEYFIEKQSENKKIIVIYGPTASGKTSLSLDVAEYIEKSEVRSQKSEEQPETSHIKLQASNYAPFIISVDARQVYRYMDIGTGKIQPDEMRGVPHHILDIIDPSEPFSVVDFREKVEELEMWKEWRNGKEASRSKMLGSHDPLIPGSLSFRNQTPLNPPLTRGAKNQTQHTKIIPILCGGTGLYIDSLIFERSYPGIEADWTLREELERFRLEYGNEALWNKLNEIDPKYAAQLHPNDRHYIIRGIEVFQKTGKSKSEAIDIPQLKYDTLFLTPFDGDRETLYDRINQRVESMFKNGLIEEVGYIRDKFSSTCPGLETIGYKEVVDYLEGKISLAESIALVQQHSRNYAKRQITWNKKYDLLCNQHASIPGSTSRKET